MALYNAGLFLVLFLSLFMILLLGGRVGMRGAVPMLLLLVGMSLWSMCQLLHIFVIDPQVKYFWYQAKFLGIVMIPPAFVLLAADISGRKNLIRPIHVASIVSFSMMILISILTDPWTHLFRKKVEYVIVEQFILIKTMDGPAFWTFTIYSYLLIIVSILLLADKARKSVGTERKQALLMLFGCTFPWIWNILFLLILDPTYPLDYTPVFMLITEIVFIITLFYYRMFNIVPFTKRAVFESLEDLVLVIDRAGIIQDMNPAAQEVFQTGKAPVGRNFSEFRMFLDPVPGESLNEIQGEFRGCRDAGSRDYLANTTPILGKHGSQIGHLIVFKDITELSESRRTLEMATRELAIQNEKKMLFVKQVNRNIRTPMNRIMGFAEVFAQKDLSDSQNEAVEHLSISGEHLIQLINDITDYSRIETGKMKLVEGSIQIFDLVRHVCRLFEYQAEQKGIAVKYHIAGDVPIRLLADSLRLTQVLSNIMGNAVKFTEKGQVTLAVVKLPGPWMEIAISDTGIGISEKNISKIFVPYQQAEEGTALKFGGTGLGLAIVKELVERMGGEVTVNSVLGEGTVFVLKLPCVESTVESPIYRIEQMTDYKNKPLNVGVVTRDPVQQILIRRFFKAWPRAVCYDVTEPSADLNSENNWDILLVNLDDFSSNLINQILQDMNSKLPALIGMTNDSDVMELEQQGRGILDDCILMPISFSTLNRTLRKIILTQNG